VNDPTAPALEPDDVVLVRSERRAVLDVLGASVLFGICNVAWRYGAGSTIVIVFVRAALGAGLAWAFGRRLGLPSWRRVLRSRMGIAAVVSAGAGMVAAGTMFRTLDGPVAGLALACIPAVAVLVRDRVGGLAAAAAVGSSLAAVVGIAHAAMSSEEATDIGWVAVLVAVGFVTLEVVSMRFAQLAVEEGADPMAVVTGTMVVACVATLPFAIVSEAGSDPSTLLSAVAAAFVVAVLGTVGRVWRTAALPAAGVPAVAASSQVTAFGTALGGVLLFGDALSAVGIVCAVLAAGLGVAAVVAGTRWRLSRDLALAASLDLRHEPTTDHLDRVRRVGLVDPVGPVDRSA
jgi:drug/metabolite transporter (DMT)-like permease